MKDEIMEQWWNKCRGKLKYSEDNLSQCHFVKHRYKMVCPAIE
jgi:hypothetical protein